MDQEQAKQKFQEADRLRGEGRHEEALTIYDALDRVFPNNTNILFARAITLANVGRLEEAREIADKLELVFSHPRVSEIRAVLFDAEKAQKKMGKCAHSPSSKSKRLPLAAGGVGIVAVVALGAFFLLKGPKDIKYWKLPGSDLSLEFVRVPAGSFTMGTNEGAGPAHTVHLDEYWIMKYEITVEQWRAYATATGRSMPPDPGWGGEYVGYMTGPPFANYPIVNVSWNDVFGFATWCGLEMPTEAQWEKAARGTDERVYPWGNSGPWDGGIYRANICHPQRSDTENPGGEDGYRYTAPVGQFEHGNSPYGIHNLCGNVWEWCFDWFDGAYYLQNPAGGWRNPRGPASGEQRVLRGGAWNSDNFLSQSGGFRTSNVEGFANNQTGGRLAWNP